MKLSLRESFRVLSDQECEKIYHAALDILGHVGVRIEHPRVAQAYAEAYQVAPDSRSTVKFAKNVVESALEQARKIYLRTTGEVKHTEVVSPVKVSMGYSSHKVVDMETDAIRPATRDDLEKACMIGDFFDEMVCIPPLFFPQDVCPKTYALHTLEILLRRVKHKKIAYTIGERDLSRYVLDMYAVIGGGSDNVIQNPPRSWVPHRFVMSPLRLDYESMETLFEYYDLGLPVHLSGTMVIPGASGPITLAGSLALATAEIIVSVMFNLLFSKEKGRMIPGPTGITFIDQATGQDCYGGPDTLLCKLAAAEMNNHLGFPQNGAEGGNTDICIPNYQAGAEKMFGLMAGVFTGQPVCVQCGQLGPGVLTGSLPQILLDMENCKMLNRFIEGIRVDEDALALDLIRSVGIGGSYLSEEHTAQNFRQEVWLPGIYQRILPELANGKKDVVVERSKEKAREILSKHSPCYLTEDQEKELRKIIARADRKFAQ
ncbi:MAG: trimethylamine methyltransferase family protein [Verrucomicrobiae bacterium]|nr:trimethylamine methyltransferase family protein [Verrucomicrobiae bacterium]